LVGGISVSATAGTPVGGTFVSGGTGVGGISVA
jgi:hypothetical protein